LLLRSLFEIQTSDLIRISSFEFVFNVFSLDFRFSFLPKRNANRNSIEKSVLIRGCTLQKPLFSKLFQHHQR